MKNRFVLPILLIVSVQVFAGDSTLVSYKITLADSSLLFRGAASLTGFWNEWSGKDSIVMTTAANSYPGKDLWTGINDAGCVVKSAWNEYGLYLMMYVRDDAWVASLNQGSGYDYDATHFYFDTLSSYDLVRTPVYVGATALTRSSQVLTIWTDTSNYTVSYQYFTSNWAAYNVPVTVLPQIYGIKALVSYIDSTHKLVELALPWNRLNASWKNNPAALAGRKIGFTAGYNDIDDAKPALSGNVLRWRKYDPFLALNRFQSWGDIILDQAGMDTIPLLIPVLPERTTNRRPALSWSSVKGATDYLLVVDDNADFSSPLLYVNTGTRTSFTPLTDLPYDTLYWKVAGSLNMEAFSKTGQFIVIPSPPVIVPGADTIVNRRPVLKWTKVGIAVNYKVLAGSTPDFSIALATCFTKANDTVFQICDSLPAGTIYWKVSSSCDFNFYSAPDTFVIMSSIPVIPPPMQPLRVTNNQKPLFNWFSVYKAQRYRIVVDTTPKFSAPILVDSSDWNYYTPSVNLPYSIIRWKVSSNYNYLQFSNIDSFKIAEVPDTPKIIAYPYDNTTERTPVLQWRKGTRNTSYRIVVDNDYYFSVPAIYDTVVTDTFFRVPRELPAGTIYWKISGNKDYSVFSKTDTFYVMIFQIPSIVTPRANAIVRPSDRLTWTRSRDPSSTVGYILTFSENQDFSGTVYNVQQQDTFCLVSALTDAGVPVNELMYWKVQAANARGALSGYSSPSSFLIYSLAAGQFRLNSFTNNCEAVPGRSSFVIRYSVKETMKTEIRVYDIRGHLIASHTGIAQRGIHTFNPGIRTSAGYYFVKYTAGNFEKKVYAIIP